MALIHLLDNNLINKIAAGEVVERPASVVKELMENSIDAGATEICVEIEQGGIELIRVSDNGKGIPTGEVKTAFLRHATSKLSAIEDLESILTLGFRGEALSSIASVAEVELITRTKDEEVGTRFTISGGIVGTKEETAANAGTRFTMRNLFFNTPARRKFLKKASTEGGYVAEVVNRIALGHPEVAIKYIVNSNTVLQTSGNGDLKTVIYYIYGKDIASKLIPVDYERAGYRVKGYVAKPELGRGNRSYESFFINGRYIKSTVVSEAVEAAYSGRLMIGRFPVFVLDLSVPDSTVDVNVHPTKLEVRFSDDAFIYEFMNKAVDDVLSDKVLIPKVEWGKEEKQEKKTPAADQLKLEEIPERDKEPVAREVQVKPIDNSEIKSDIAADEVEDFDYSKGYLAVDGYDNAVLKVNEPTVSATEATRRARLDIVSAVMGNDGTEVADRAEPIIPLKSLRGLKAESDKEYSQDAKDNTELEERTDTELSSELDKATENATVKEPFFKDYRIVGQVFNTYWIVECGGSIYMIDQHAAHERILYEELRAKLKARESVGQLLLEPAVVNVTEKEKQLVEDNRELLESFGFEFELFGESCYAVRSVPYIFTKYDYTASFTDIIDSLADKSLVSLYDTKLDAVATMSCKAAVKAHDRLSEQEARTLVERLLELDNPFNCPHGRPTVIEMSRYELEKKFKRIQ